MGCCSNTTRKVATLSCQHLLFVVTVLLHRKLQSWLKIYLLLSLCCGDEVSVKQECQSRTYFLGDSLCISFEGKRKYLLSWIPDNVIAISDIFFSVKVSLSFMNCNAWRDSPSYPVVMIESVLSWWQVVDDRKDLSMMNSDGRVKNPKDLRASLFFTFLGCCSFSWTGHGWRERRTICSESERKRLHCRPSSLNTAWKKKSCQGTKKLCEKNEGNNLNMTKVLLVFWETFFDVTELLALHCMHFAHWDVRNSCNSGWWCLCVIITLLWFTLEWDRDRKGEKMIQNLSSLSKSEGVFQLFHEYFLWIMYT